MTTTPVRPDVIPQRDSECNINTDFINTDFDVDIFCTVIDNFGDIGVAWRLAQQLQQAHNQQVRLWLDDLSALICLCPEVLGQVDVQNYLGINLRVWRNDKFPVDMIPAKLVIEAFGCTIPSAYRLQMKHTNSHWVNLEYFSAENWVVDCHLMPSLQSDGLQKTFFMPSIRQHTGGLLREQNLIQQRNAFQHDASQQTQWLTVHSIPPPTPRSLKLSLFSYENCHIGTLIAQLIHAPYPITLYVPQSKSLVSVNQALSKTLTRGDTYRQGQLSLHLIPFLPQTEYDHLLWYCDFNFVRGEDSLVRAIWAGKPFIWHIYPTEDSAHHDKLNAFLQHYYANTPADSLIQLNRLWNSDDCHDDDTLLTLLFHQFFEQDSAMLASATQASNRQIAHPSLADQLMAWLNDARSV